MDQLYVRHERDSPPGLKFHYHYPYREIDPTEGERYVTGDWRCRHVENTLISKSSFRL